MFTLGLCFPWQGTDLALKELRSELQNFGSGPPAKLAEGKSTQTVDRPQSIRSSEYHQTVTTLHDFVARFGASIFFDSFDAPTCSCFTQILVLVFNRFKRFQESEDLSKSTVLPSHPK